MSTVPISQADVISRLLNGDEELTGPEWKSLHKAVGALIVEVQQFASHKETDSSVLAVEEAVRKLHWTPAEPDSLYAAKLARCGQALRRHRARLSRAGGPR